MTIDTDTERRHGVSRRTVVGGAVWSVPAIVVLSAAPASALGSPLCAAPSATGIGCKFPGQSTAFPFAYATAFTFTNQCSLDVTVTLGTALFMSPASTTVNYQYWNGSSWQPLVGSTFQLGLGETKTVYISFDSTNSANGDLSLVYTVDDNDGNPDPATATALIDLGFPPQCPADIPNPPGAATTTLKKSSVQEQSTVGGDTTTPEKNKGPADSGGASSGEVTAPTDGTPTADAGTPTDGTTP